MESIFYNIDSALIYLFRLTDIPVLGYYTGTFIICMISVIAGRMTLMISSAINEKYLKKDHQNMIHMHNLSLYALVSRDKGAYSNCNKQANEAFGKVFFSNIALGSSALWPLPFILAWMQYRFGAVEFMLPFDLPVIGSHAGFMFTFFPILVLAYIVFGRVYSILAKTGILKNRTDNNPLNGSSEEKLLNLKDLTAELNVPA